MDIEEFAGIPAQWLGFPEIEVADAAHLLAGMEPPKSRAASLRLRGATVRAIADQIRLETGAKTIATIPGERTTITQAQFREYARKRVPVSSPDMHQEDLKALAGGCYSIHRAAHLIAAQLGYTEDGEKKLLDSMARAAYLGKLKTRGRDGHDIYSRTDDKPETDHDYFRWVAPADVNEWAKASGFRWFWLVDGSAPEVVSQKAEAMPPADSKTPEKPVAREAVRIRFATVWKGDLESDLGHSGRNGLTVAKAGKRNWYLSKIEEWGVANGRIDPARPAGGTPTPANSVFDLPARLHSIR